MWSYNYTSYSNELYHHGVKGQKWGVRRDKKQYRSTGRRSNDKTDARLKNGNKNNFINKETMIRSGIFVTGMAAAYYLKKHPDKAVKAIDFVTKKSNEPASHLNDFDNYKVWSKKLNRYFTVEEMIEKGLY